MGWFWFLVFWGLIITVGLVLIYHVYVILFKSKWKFGHSNKTVVIVGGSKGIGLALAKQCAKQGARNIVLVARNEEALENAKQDVKSKTEYLQKVYAYSCDVTSFEKCQEMARWVLSRKTIENIDVLYMVQGVCVPGYVVEQDIDIARRMMDVNYFGSLNVFKVFLENMIHNRRMKHVVFVGSALSLLNFSGYTLYAPTKYALKGLVEGLSNEFQGFPISFHISIPVDTDTPGFKEENRTKPEDCKKMSEAAGLMTPDQSAKEIVRCLKRGRFYLSESFEMSALIYSTRGFGPLGRECPFILLMKSIFFAFPAVFMTYDFSDKSRRYRRTKRERWISYLKGEVDEEEEIMEKE